MSKAVIPAIISPDDDITGERNGFRFELIEDDRHDEAILENIREHFSRDEVLGMSLGFDKEFAESIVVYAEKGLKLGRNVSIVAYDIESGKLAGVRISKLAVKGKKPKDENPYEYDEKFKKVGAFLDHMDAHVNVFELYNTDKYVDFLMVSVDKQFRGRGLATELILRTLRLSKKQGLNIVKSVFTGLISQAIGIKLGFELVYEQLYSEYKVDGVVVFDKTDPHPSSKLMCMKY